MNDGEHPHHHSSHELHPDQRFMRREDGPHSTISTIVAVAASVILVLLMAWFFSQDAVARSTALEHDVVLHAV